MKTLSKLSLILVTFISLSLNAQYYWVGGAGDWSDFNNHWATTSGGSTFHTSQPSEFDDVIFDANSFSGGGQVVTVTADADCRNMDWSAVTVNASLSQNPGIDMRIHGDLTLAATATYEFTILEFRANDPGNTITTNGSSLGAGTTRFEGTGTYELTDDLTTGAINLWQGTLTTNGNNIFADQGFSIHGASPKALNLGDSEIHTGQFRFYDDNLLLNAGTSTIFCSQFYGSAEQDHTYYSVAFTNESIVFQGGGNFHNVDISQTGNGYVRFTAGETYNIEQFTGNSTRNSAFKFYTDVEGTEATIVKTDGMMEFDYLELQDIHVTGGATFQVNNAVDNGNNVGWNLTDLEPWDFYWIGNGGDWEDASHWSDVSGGLPAYNAFPSRFDNVYFDENSFTMVAQTVDVNQPIDMKDLDMSEVTFSPTIYAPYGNRLNVYGDMFIPDDVTKNIHRFDFHSTGEATIHPGAIGSHYTGIHNGGDYTFTGDFNVSAFDVNDASFTLEGNMTSNFNFTVYSQGSNINLADGTIYCRDFVMQSSTAVLDAGTSTITVYRDFKGGDRDYYHVIMSEDGQVFGDNTFEILEMSPGSLTRLEANTTQTVNQDLVMNGTSDLPISLSSSESGVQASIAKANGTVNASYVILQDNNATGGATFNATQALDNGNNTGWNISVIEPQDFYWVGGAGSWSDYENHWATSSGGSNFFTFAPSVLDNVYFDENSFTEEGQAVSVDVEQINFHNMDWSGALFNPTFAVGQNTMNVYGSMNFIENMTLQSVRDVYLLSNDDEFINTPNGNSFGTNAYVYLSSGGNYDVQSDFTCRELHLSNGEFHSNGNDVWVDFKVYFLSSDAKVFDLANSFCYFRSLGWNGPGENLVMDNTNGTIQWSGGFSPNNFNTDLNITLILNDMICQSNGFLDSADITSEIDINTLTIAPGKSLELWNGTNINVNQLICAGTAEENITITGTNGIQGSITQTSGVVNGEYLLLDNTAALGGATFYANNSLDNGNVSGWIFTGLAQSITVDEQADVLEDVGSIMLSATASSGLPVSYEVLSGPAGISGEELIITGPGLVVVEVTQLGDDSFNPAPPVTIEFCSLPLQPTINATWEPGSVVLQSSSLNGNQWFDQDGLLVGADDVTYETFVDGTFYVHVDIDGCVSEISEPFLLFIDNVTENPLSLTKVFPNPASELVHVQLPVAVEGASAMIYDGFGRVVVQQNIIGLNTSIDVSALANGTYYVHVTSKEGQFSMPLMIK